MTSNDQQNSSEPRFCLYFPSCYVRELHVGTKTIQTRQWQWCFFFLGSPESLEDPIVGSSQGFRELVTSSNLH